MTLRDDVPLFLKPRLRLFLSADIVGSTSLKQSQVMHLREGERKRGASWFSIIQGFYIEAKIAFLDEWTRASNQHGKDSFPLGEEPLLWKTIGDEILFTKVLTDYRQLAFALACWIRALRNIREFLKSRDARLDIKSAAWLAGFPVKNKDVILGNSTELFNNKVENYVLESGRLLNEYYANPTKADVTVDFVGPSVDVGFRLAAHATARRFVVSVGIPYILSSTTPIDEELNNEIRFHFGGTVPLKGVFGGLPYPLFWIDMGEERTAATLEDALTGQKLCEPRDIQQYCAAFYREQSTYTFRPFIYEQSEHRLTDRPDWYNAQLDVLVNEFLKPTTKIEDGVDPPSSKRVKIDPNVDDIVAKLRFIARKPE